MSSWRPVALFWWPESPGKGSSTLVAITPMLKSMRAGSCGGRGKAAKHERVRSVHLDILAPKTAKNGAQEQMPITGTLSIGLDRLARFNGPVFIVVSGFGLVACYVLLEWVSFIHSYKGFLITPWSPGVGVLFAVIVRGTNWHGLLLFIAAIASELIVDQNELGISVTMASAGIVATGYTAAAAMSRQNITTELGPTRLREVMTVVMAGMGAAIVVAALLVALLVAAGRLSFTDFFPSAIRSMVGDAIGIAVISPLLLRLPYLYQHLTLRNLLSFAPESGLYGVIIIIGLWVIISHQNEHGSNFFYVMFLPLVITSVRFGLDGACLSLLAMQIGLVQLLQYYRSDAETFTEYQTLMFALTATGLILGALVSDREQARRAYQHSMDRLKAREAEAIRTGRFNLVSGMASALAHELNQPITAARASARAAQYLLAMPSPDRSRVDRNLATVMTQIDLAGAIVRRIREFLRRGRPIMSDINVKEWLTDALLLIEPEAAAAHVAIELTVEENVTEIYGDCGQLEQVILNLTRNSIEAIVGAKQYGGRVRVTAARSERVAELEITVADTGPGISTELIDRLFEPLTTSKEDGLGLGLSISGLIVEAHGGRAWLASGAPYGTEFRFVLPLKSGRVPL